MSRDTLFRVALEFDYPEAIVRRAMRERTFYAAGELIDYLEDHWNEFEMNGDELEMNGNDQNKEASINVKELKQEVVNKQLGLKEETEILYRQSICLVCQSRKRNYVTLPCSHFTLCDTCERTIHHCPIRSCGEQILSTIHTYQI